MLDAGSNPSLDLSLGMSPPSIGNTFNDVEAHAPLDGRDLRVILVKSLDFDMTFPWKLFKKLSLFKIVPTL